MIFLICSFEGILISSEMAQWLSWLERRPVTAEVESSSLFWVVYGVLAQLGEHLPYKQRVIGSSPIGSICRSGGTGRRPGLKIPWVAIPVPVRFRPAASVEILETLESSVKTRVFKIFFIHFGAKIFISFISAFLLTSNDGGNL